MAIDLTPEELHRLRSFFVEEAEEHLEAIERALAALEAMPSDGAAVSALLRKLHTLKGSAGTVGLDELSRSAHLAEDRVAAFRDGVRPPLQGEMQALIAAIEQIRRLVGGAARLVHGPPPMRTPPPPAGASPPEEWRGSERRAVESGQIRVEVEQVDEMMEAAGELVIDRARIARRLIDLDGCVRDLARARAALRSSVMELGPDAGGLGEVELELSDALAHLERATTGMGDDSEHLARTAQVLEEGLQRVRMMEVGRLFERLAGAVKEIARRTGKEVALATWGEQTAIDKAIGERVIDPLLHLLRNAVAHGIEPPAARVAAGKPGVGRVDLSARWRGSEIIIEVGDDGAGVDLDRMRAALVRAHHQTAAEAAALPDAVVVAAIFEHGLSTRDSADDLAGRGVGLDAVKETIERLGGAITCASTPGQGTRFTVRLPLTTAIIGGLLFKVGGHVYAVPASSVVDTAPIAAADFQSTPTGERLLLRGRALPLVRLGALLGEPSPPGSAMRRAAVVLDHEGLIFGLTCDKLIGPRQIVVKGLGPLLSSLPLYAGATISGAGKVQLILDVATLADHARRGVTLGARPTGSVGGPRVLLADDSRSVRETAALILLQAGYRVETVPDGWEAWELLQDRRFDLVLTDGEMPRLDGYDLTGHIRRHPDLRDLPVVVMTSRTVETGRTRALSCGADAFLAKPLRRQAILDAVAAALAAGRRSSG
ncbi:MAG: hybrid sensor histidine kinase/response regulator [Myxococcales bacterium]|nr:hybrid sensor histidine kinase/response regulator [Myxococcales bacterium]